MMNLFRIQYKIIISYFFDFKNIIKPFEINFKKHKY